MKSKKILATLLALSVLSTSALVGCGDKKEDPKGNESGKDASGRPEMDKDQYLNLFGGEPQLLDPTIASITTTWQSLAPIHEGLTRVVGTESGEDKIEPGVAESWEGNADSTEFTFKLRKDAKWQDGTPVTAKDFEYSIRRVCDPRVAAEYSSFLAPIIKGADDATKLTGKDDATIEAALEKVGVKAVDDYTLKFELVQSTPYFLQLSYFPTFKPVQKKAIEEFGKKYGTEADLTMGNGPYILKEWKHNGNLTYEKNPNYWDKDHVYLEKVTMNIIQDPNSAMQALYTGEVDRGRVTKPEWIQKFDASQDFDVKKVEGYNVETLIFNPKSGHPTSNAKIRKALATGFDREQYSQDIADGNNIPGYQFIPDNVTIGGKKFQEQAGNPKYTKKLVDEVTNPKALLIEGMKEAGLGEDPSKLKISIHMRGDTPFCKTQGEWFQNKWKEKLGIDVEVRMTQYQIMYEEMKNGNFDIAVGGWSADFDDPSNFIDIYNSDGGYYDYLGWNNKEFDKLIKEAASEKDSKKRVELYSKAEKILTYDDTLITPIEHGLDKYYFKKFIKNYNAPGLATYCMDFKGAYTQGRK